MIRQTLSRVAFAAALVGGTGSVALADLSRGVISTFHGQLVISQAELPEGKNDADTVKKIKAAQLKELDGTPQGDVQSWRFHYTAFLTHAGATQLKMEFLREGGGLAADEQITGVDPKSAVLSGDIGINEDEGLAKGKTYTIQLITSGNQVVAKTTLTMK